MISEVCKISGLTRKAIEYYEAKGLISPEISDNGYRSYSEADLSVLKEIAVLRSCGLAVAEIGAIISGEDKPSALAKRVYLAELGLQRLETAKERLLRLCDRYDIDKEFAGLNSDCDLLTIKERLALAFPGQYGIFISLHFGRFLNEPADTMEKQQACNRIIRWLDSVELYLSPELSEYMSELFDTEKMSGATELESAFNNAMSEAYSDIDRYIEHNRDVIDEYLAYKASEEYKSSKAAMLESLMKDFQEKSGYRENLIENIAIISPTYSAYLEQGKAASQKILTAFPSIEAIY